MAFTNDEIAQIIEEFFATVGARQYIGARYVPIFGRKGEDSIIWDGGEGTYEPLTVVLYQGNSFTSRQFVPVGVDISNDEFWAETGNYNAQVEQYRQDTIVAQATADNAHVRLDDLDLLIPTELYNADNTITDEIRRHALAFDTVADMKASDSLFDGAVCHTNGFHSIGDGGAAWYTISNLAQTANEMDIIECGNFFANLVTNKTIANPMQYGAYGNGVISDTEVIKYLIASNDILTIDFGCNTYLIERIGSEANIFEGKSTSLIGKEATLLFGSSVQGSTNIFVFTGTKQQQNQIVSGLRFVTATEDFTKVNHLIEYIFSEAQDILYNLRIVNNYFGKTKGYKIYTLGFSNGGFNNCSFSNNIVYGCFLYSASFGDSNKINGNSLYGSENIELSSPVIDVTQTSGSFNCVVSGNNCTSGLGSFTNMMCCYFEGNQIEYTTEHDYDYGLIISGGAENIIENCNFNMHLLTDCLLLNCINSVVSDCHFASPKDYVLVSLNHSVLFSNCRISANGVITVHKHPEALFNCLWCTDVLYESENISYFVDSSLVLWAKPKIANVTCAVRPLFPSDYVNCVVGSCEVRNRRALFFTDSISTYASVPCENE